MRVLLTIHHHLDPNLGAPGATLALGGALEAAGCRVDYFGFEKAFSLPTETEWSVAHSLKFPWRTAAFLARQGHEFDVIDASTGDTWVWTRRKRPGTKPSPALVTRSHGLEHMADKQARSEAAASGQRLSWKYPLYHGGFRLWEVAQTVQHSDRVILLNEIDQQFAHESLGVPRERMAIVPMGVAHYFFGSEKPIRENEKDQPLQLAFLGSWIPRKGSRVITEATKKLHDAGVAFRLTLMGTGGSSAEAILAEFDPSVRENVRVVPRFAHTELPQLLSDKHILLFPSLAEGFSRALVEAMACGLAPIATPVGGAPAVIRSGDNGLLVATGDAEALAEAVRRLHAAPETLRAMRCRARQDASAYRWDAIARQTIAVYESALRSIGRPVGEARP